MLWLLFLVLTILFWGSYNLFYKAITTANMNIFLSVIIIGLVSAIVAVPFLISNYAGEGIKMSYKGIIFSAIMGLCMGIGTIFFFYTFRYGASASIAIPIYGIGALLIGSIGGIIVFKETFNLRIAIGFGLGIASIVLLAIR